MTSPGRAAYEEAIRAALEQRGHTIRSPKVQASHTADTALLAALLAAGDTYAAAARQATAPRRQRGEQGEQAAL